MSTEEAAAQPDAKPRRRKKSPVFVQKWEVMEDLGVLDPRTVDARIARGEIPRPVRRVANNRPIWLRKEWNAWVNRKNASTASDGKGDGH